MGVRMKGGMHCPNCGPTIGQKSTNKAVKTMATIGSGGAYTPGPGAYHCHRCGTKIGISTGDAGWKWTLGVLVALVILGIGITALGNAVGTTTPTTPTCPTYVTDCIAYGTP